jgi:hypothetical protein
MCRIWTASIRPALSAVNKIEIDGTAYARLFCRAMRAAPIISRLTVAAVVTLPAMPVLGAEPPLPPPVFEVSSLRSDPGRAARRFRQPYGGELIDTLAHITPTSVRRGREAQSDSDIADRIAGAGVARAYLMPTPNEGGRENRADGTAEKIALARRAQGRLGVFCGGDYLTTWLYNTASGSIRESELQARLRRLETELDGGVCAGVGELGLLHFNKTGDQPEIRLRPTFPPLLDVIALAERKGAWIDVHAEPVEPNGVSHESETFGALALWLTRHRSLKLILSHTAMTNPVNARRLLHAHPGVMLTVKLVRSSDAHWSHLEPVLNPRGELYEDWAALMEEMPGRFFVGSDAKFASRKHESGDRYDEEIARYRRVLGALAPAAADAIARGNARRLLPVPAL